MIADFLGSKLLEWLLRKQEPSKKKTHPYPWQYYLSPHHTLGSIQGLLYSWGGILRWFHPVSGTTAFRQATAVDEVVIKGSRATTRVPFEPERISNVPPN